MKTRKTTAVVLPIPLFEEGERLANRFGISRSELYARAISSYISERQKERTIEELDRIYGEEGNELDSEIIELQKQSLSKEKWWSREAKSGGLHLGSPVAHNQAFVAPWLSFNQTNSTVVE